MTDTYKLGDKVLIVATVDGVNDSDPVQPIRVRIAGELANIWPRAEDIHGPAPAPATGGTVRVRAFVVVAAKGDFWSVHGSATLPDDSALEVSARAILDSQVGPCSFSYITADIPLPTIPTITAKVEDGE